VTVDTPRAVEPAGGPDTPMLVPVLEDDAPARRPWLCLALALLWAGVHVAALAGAGPAPERFGLAPDAPSLPGAVTWFALHVHTPHLLLSLALLALAVAPLECRWGPLFTGAFATLLLALSGAAYVLLTNGSERPLVGPSAALTGLAVAAVARFLRDGLRFQVPFAVRGRRPGFRLPAPAIAAIWFVGEVALEVLSDVSGPTRGIHYGAHAVAAVGGAVGVWAVGRGGLEAGPLRPRASARQDRAAQATLARAQAARDEERPDAALDELAAAVAASPRDARLVAALWETACAAGRRDAARTTALRFVADAWARGDREAAAAVWRAVVGAEPDAPLDVRMRLGLAAALHEAGHRADAARTLRGALADTRALTPGTALRVAEAARAIHPPTGVEAARRALAVDGLDETKRARIAALIASLEAEPANLEDLDLGPAPPSRAGETRDAADAAPGPDEPALTLAEPSTPDPTVTDAPEDPYALRLDATDAEADAPLELGADGSLGSAEEESPFGAIDLAGEHADVPPEPVAAPPLAGTSPAAPGAPGGARALPPISTGAPGGDGDADTGSPDADALDPAALDLGEPGPEAASSEPALDSDGPGDADALELGGEAPGEASLVGATRDDGLDAVSLDDAELEALAGFEDPGDLAGPPEPRFGATKVIDVVPRALREDALEVASEAGSASRLPLARVEAVAVARLRDAGPKPVIVIDLLLNWSAEDGGPLKVARLRSDRFDPRALAAADSPVDAIRTLAATLLERSGALPLPDPDAARGRPFATFETLASYEREVLLVGS